MLSQIKPQAPVKTYESALIAGLYLKRRDLPLLFSLWTAPVAVLAVGNGCGLPIVTSPGL